MYAFSEFRYDAGASDKTNIYVLLLHKSYNFVKYEQGRREPTRSPGQRYCGPPMYFLIFKFVSIPIVLPRENFEISVF